MKRSIVTHLGVLGLCQFFASAALATELCYSTGPVENAMNLPGPPPTSTVVFVKVLNNSTSNSVDAKVLTFGLNGSKILQDEQAFTVAPQASGFIAPPVDEGRAVFQFEIQVKLTGDKPNKALLGAFGTDKDGALVPSHRLVHTEWTEIRCSEFGPSGN